MHKLKLAIFIGQLLFSTLDARVTRRSADLGAHEYNPFVRPMVHSNAIYFDFIGESVVSYIAGRKLERTHPKLSRFCFAWQLEDLSSHASGYGTTEYNFLQWQNRQNSFAFPSYTNNHYSGRYYSNLYYSRR